MTLRQSKDSLYHSAQAIATLWRDVLLQIKSTEHIENVIVDDFPSRPAVVGRLKNCNQPTYNIGITIRPDRELCLLACADRFRDQPDLTLTAVNSVLLSTCFRGKGR